MSVDASQAQAFTVECDFILNVLKTPCSVFEPFMPGEATPDILNVSCNAIWDTGATGTVISSRVANKLGLSPIGVTTIQHANGTSDVNKYLINVGLPNGMGFAFIEVTEGNFNETFDVLIGMDIISKGDFSISNCKGNTCFSFRIPSLDKIDFVEDSNKKKKIAQIPQTNASKKVGRNEPCPCGSGKKYKNCCMNR